MPKNDFTRNLSVDAQRQPGEVISYTVTKDVLEQMLKAAENHLGYFDYSKAVRKDNCLKPLDK